MSVVARSGRHRQRYDKQIRLVAGCVPYRLKQSGEHTTSLVDRLEVLMISSPNRHDLVFPKGGWEDDETLEQAACREALEEAGIKGILHEESLGIWVSRSKSSESSCSSEGFCRCYMFALKVTEELDSWPEQACHQRRWLSVPEARHLCRYPWMQEALGACVNFLQHQDAISASDPSFLCEAVETRAHRQHYSALCCLSSKQSAIVYHSWTSSVCSPLNLFRRSLVNLGLLILFWLQSKG